MEQVFDFREFMLTLLRKCKLLIILGIIFALLGAAFGFMKASKDEYLTTSGASVNLMKKTLETSPLTDTMKNIDSVISDNFFYTGLVNEILSKMDSKSYDELIGHMKKPSITDLKNIIKVYTKGNLILIDVTSEQKELTQQASTIGINYTTSQIQKLNRNVDVMLQESQTVNVNEQQGSSKKHEMIKFGVVGFAGGVVVAILWVFFVGVFDLRVKSEEDLKKYRLPVLGELTRE